ncbi:ferredoxin reductase-like C-terminal NADP-linked domain-containing protein [Lentinus tigrinus ALCF2SS1-7]|uniref:Ferredoxin reductase-like C-terminal NADP-linked domain-containing protein n=1 Tax=Lentinus tigrinus ALCF2SS1-6 TaxID=1328759 RepID=A0A5C2SW75_9APHY|nr:ferredoxin reductase-like C-terminal NADP-linked domain-containing protein [Lentinus tigrinus ALCF2SS1-6]RPD81218.1 ferredoxin reductase-like C-terminal NADP-linked domain-containing protein [Lentinus tigrinus ALCF2SS1-7]
MLRSATSLARRRLPLHGSFRHVSTQTQTPSAPGRSGSTALLVGLGGSAVIASYFLWPDPSRAAPTKKNALLSPTHFTPVTVTSTELCPDPNTRLMTLTVPRQSIPSLQEAAFEPIWSVYIKDDDIQVERPFTPLEGMDSEGRMKFWVKRYEKGEVGRWLHSKKPGDHIEIRGPLKTWPWKEEEWDEVIMVSGGTGITPFCQLIHKELLSQPTPNSKTRFTLLHSSRRPTELPPSEMLKPIMEYSQAHPDKLRLSLFVDASDGPSHPAVPSSSITVGRIGKVAIERATGLEKNSWWQRVFGASIDTRSQDGGRGKRIMFLVCGPDPMVSAIAGPFGRNFSQGEVGGVLGELGYAGDSVWKL